MERMHLTSEFSTPPLFGEAGASCTETALHEPFLSICDVEDATCLRNLRRARKPGSLIAGSECVFLSGSAPILLVTISPAVQYETYKTMVPKNVKSMIHGLGEEGFVGPDIAGQMPYLLVFRRRDFTVSLTTATTSDTGKNILSLEQLAAIGSIIDQRIIGQYETRPALTSRAS